MGARGASYTEHKCIYGKCCLRCKLRIGHSADMPIVETATARRETTHAEQADEQLASCVPLVATVGARGGVGVPNGGAPSSRQPSDVHARGHQRCACKQACTCTRGRARGARGSQYPLKMKLKPLAEPSISHPGWSRAGRRWCKSTSSSSSFVY